MTLLLADDLPIRSGHAPRTSSSPAALPRAYNVQQLARPLNPNGTSRMPGPSQSQGNALLEVLLLKELLKR